MDAGYEFSVTIDQTAIVTLALPTTYSSFFGVTYETPNGNQPTQYGNQLLVFNGGPAIPSAIPAGTGAAAPNGGAIVYPAAGTTFGARPYTCAYSVGPFSVSGSSGSYPNVAATLYLPGGVGTQPTQLTSSALGIQTAQTAFVVWTYSLPAGMNPATNGAWIGLWYGTAAPYTDVPDFFAPVLQSSSTGLSPMPGVRMAGKSPYTAALFTSGYNATASLLQQTALATVIVFTTGPALPP